MSLPERSRVWVAGSSDRGAAGSGICLTQTTTFMACIVDYPRGVPPFYPGDPAPSSIIKASMSPDLKTQDHVSPLAGKPAPKELLVDLARLSVPIDIPP